MAARRELARDPDTRLAQRLIREGRVPAEIVQAALARKTSTRDLRFEDALLEVGLSEVQLLRILAEVYRTQFITTDKLSKIRIAERTLRLVPKALAERRLVVPLALDAERQLLVVTPDPETLDTIKDILIASQAREVKALVARPLAVRAAISKHYDGDQSAFTALAPTGVYTGEAQQITDSQSSFALFHDQALLDLDSPVSEGARITQYPSSSSRPPSHRSQPALRRAVAQQTVAQAAEAPLRIEPPLPMLEEIEPDLDQDPNKETSAIHPRIESVHLSPRVSSIPPPAEPEELEIIDELPVEITPLIASPLGLAEALVRLHERGRRYLADHSVTVAKLAAKFCAELGVSEAEQLQAELAGLIHDLGKSRIHHLTAYNVGTYADHERLARREYAQPTLLLKGAGLPLSVVSAVNHMYERYDGQGFPSGLQGEEIPLLSRIVALTDSYADLTMSSANPFRRLLSPEEAVNALHSTPIPIFDSSLLDSFALSVIGVELPEAVLEELEPEVLSVSSD